MIIREAYAQGSADLKYAEIPSPALDASVLLAYVLNTTREKLVSMGMEKISEKNCAKFCELIERRAGGECVAYIVGKKEFWGLEFCVTSSVLVPRPETEVLVEAALEILREQGTGNREQKTERKTHVLDLCTGSGAVAVSLKHEIPQLDIYATDISKKALEVAKKNAKHLLPENCNISFYLGDLFDALSSPCSLIVSNPPYVPTHELETLFEEVRKEPRVALDGGEDGLSIITRIIENAPNYLQRGGHLLMEADPRQMENIKLLLANRGFFDIQLYKDLLGHNRVIGGNFEY